MTLSTKERKHFRAIAHHLKPVVTVGDKGLTTNVVAELSRALDDHELIKVRIAGGRDHRNHILTELCQRLTAESIQLVGGVATIYRPSSSPNNRLSNLIRHEEGR